MPGAQQWTSRTLFQIHTTLKNGPHSPYFTPKGAMSLRLLNAKDLVNEKCFSWMPYMKLPLFAVFASVLMQTSLSSRSSGEPTISHLKPRLTSALLLSRVKSINSQFVLQTPPSPWARSQNSSLCIAIYQKLSRKENDRSCPSHNRDFSRTLGIPLLQCIS